MQAGFGCSAAEKNGVLWRESGPLKNKSVKICTLPPFAQTHSDAILRGTLGLVVFAENWIKNEEQAGLRITRQAVLLPG